MKIIIMPQNRIGKWSVKFLGGVAGFYVLSLILLPFALRREGEMVSMNPAFQPFLMVTGIAALACGLGAFGTGLYSFIKEKERSVLVSMAVFAGTMVVLFLLGEVLIPH